ncbi:MAG: DNA replication complex GINS family protein [Nitrososphaeraceae archaeon]|nr:DNA replication complex GINS family protein [Nitrososphaeraceae archaeon]
MTPRHKIETIQSAYHFEYMMQDIRVTYKRDLKVSLGSITIDAKEGDISSLPRWLAKLFAEESVIEIQDNDSSAYISRALNRERISKPHDLSGLDPDFYIRVHDYIEGLNEREKESIIVSLLSFVTSRLEKIVKLAAASALSPELEAKLSVEEKELYLLIHSYSSEFKQKVLKI